MYNHINTCVLCVHMYIGLYHIIRDNFNRTIIVYIHRTQFTWTFVNNIFRNQSRCSDVTPCYAILC